MVLIENVPRQLQTKICSDNKYLFQTKIRMELKNRLLLDKTIFNSAFGVSQNFSGCISYDF